jgi:hypothetical protein
MLKYWMYGLPKDDKRESVDFLKQKGFNCLVTAPDEKAAELASEAGMEFYACIGAYSREGFSDECLSVDINGDRRVWFNSTCPNRSDVREANIEAIDRVARSEGVRGIFIDGCRFASPASGLDAFFTCFCPVCEKKSEAMGYDFPAMKRDVGELYKIISGASVEVGWNAIARGIFNLLHLLVRFPGVIEWLRFREECTTEHISALSKVVRSAKKGSSFGIYSFTPLLSPLVGQSYVKMRDHIDVFSPMIYRNYPPPDGPACLNRELYEIASWFERVSASEDEKLSILFNLCGYPIRYWNLSQLDKELPIEAIEWETKKARALIGGGKELAPIIYLDDDRIEDGVGAVREGGADGVAFFIYKEEWKDRIKRSAEVRSATSR